MDDIFAIIFLLIYLIIIFVIVAVIVIARWKVYEKAGKPGWASIVPIYNILVLLEIAEKPSWWVILHFIPIANLIAGILVNIEIAKKFGQETVFGVGLSFLPIIFWPMLAFGSYKFVGSVAVSNTDEHLIS